MANNTITFDPDDGVAYGVNVVINTGANFQSSFQILNNDKTNFDFSTANAVGIATTTGWTGSSQMTKTVAVGSSAYPAATFTVGFTSAADGQFNISLGSTATSALNNGRYVYDILVSSGATIYRIVEGNVLVISGVSSAP
jgi:hypothetical protein|tara:strand:+ start:2052 stop:2471 length:420 start_codon:yes stop_codon:yes gene_type:complete